MAQAVTQLDEPERKLAALMAADVVGFSRMMGNDEAGTLARLDAARREVIHPLLQQHRGRVFKLMGDGALVEFPSVVLALRAAVAVQEALRTRNAPLPDGHRIVLRMGVHQADVVVQGADLLGEGVNIAARLERLSEPGGICISERVREDAEGRIALELRDGGEQALRNIARPVHVFHVRLRAGPADGLPDARVPEGMAPAGHGGAHPLRSRPTPWDEAPDGAAPPAGAPLAPPDAGDADRTVAFVPGPSAHKLVLLGAEFGEAAPQGGADWAAQGRELTVGHAPVILGRMPPSDVILSGDGVSRAHCRVELVGGAVCLTDLNSTNGTFVDDCRVSGSTRLRPGALLRIGPHVLRYVWQSGMPELVDANATAILPADADRPKARPAG